MSIRVLTTETDIIATGITTIVMIATMTAYLTVMTADLTIPTVIDLK